MQKQIKAIENQGRKQVDVIMNQNKRQVGLINNDGKNLPYKETFKKCLKIGKKGLMKY